jgi:hypothetical protein
MTTATAPTPTRPRIAAVVASAVAGLLAIAFLAAGAALLWGDAQKDADGYHATDHQRFATGAHALATDNLDVDLDGAGWLVDRDGFGRIRIDAQPRAGKPLFVGIARTSDVAAYLRGTPHTTVTDVRYDPFDASYRDHRGERAPQRPADQRFWAASAHGTGAQTVTWDVEDGDWSVVVMNEDGSRAVDAAVSAGAKVPFLAPAGWAAIGGGVLLAALAGASLLVAVRRRS